MKKFTKLRRRNEDDQPSLHIFSDSEEEDVTRIERNSVWSESESSGLTDEEDLQLAPEDAGNQAKIERIALENALKRFSQPHSVERDQTNEDLYRYVTDRPLENMRPVRKPRRPRRTHIPAYKNPYVAQTGEGDESDVEEGTVYSVSADEDEPNVIDVDSDEEPENESDYDDKDAYVPSEDEDISVPQDFEDVEKCKETARYLYDYQIRPGKLIKSGSNKSMMIVYSAGSGKTLTSFTLINAMMKREAMAKQKITPWIIVAPRSLIQQWRKQMRVHMLCNVFFRDPETNEEKQELRFLNYFHNLVTLMTPLGFTQIQSEKPQQIASSYVLVDEIQAYRFVSNAGEIANSEKKAKKLAKKKADADAKTEEKRKEKLREAAKKREHWPLDKRVAAEEMEANNEKAIIAKKEEAAKKREAESAAKIAKLDAKSQTTRKAKFIGAVSHSKSCFFITATPIYRSVADMASYLWMMQKRRAIPTNTQLEEVATMIVNAYKIAAQSETTILPGMTRDEIRLAKQVDAVRMRTKTEVMERLWRCYFLFYDAPDDPNIPVIFENFEHSKFDQAETAKYQLANTGKDSFLSESFQASNSGTKMRDIVALVKAKLEDKNDTRKEGKIIIFSKNVKSGSKKKSKKAAGSVNVVNTQDVIVVEDVIDELDDGDSEDALGISKLLPFLEDANIAYLNLSSTTTSESRDAMIQSFNEGLSTERVILAGPASSVGTDFKGVTCVILMEPSWHEPQTIQMIGRAARRNAHEFIKNPYLKNKVHVYRMISILSDLDASLLKINKRTKEPKWLIELMSMLKTIEDNEDDESNIAALKKYTSDQKVTAKGFNYWKEGKQFLDLLHTMQITKECESLKLTLPSDVRAARLRLSQQQYLPLSAPVLIL